MIFTPLETEDVFDIACDYKYCAVLIDKGEIRTWGKYLLEKTSSNQDKEKNQNAKNKNKNQQDAGDKENERKTLPVSNFPLNNKGNLLMESIVTGSNHTLAICHNQNKKVYVWGYNNVSNRLGVSNDDESEKARGEPVVVQALQDVLDEQKKISRLDQA